MTLEAFSLVLIVLLALVGLAIYFRSQIRGLQHSGDATPALQIMQQQIDALRAQLQESLNANAQQISRQMAQTIDTVGNGLNQITSQLQTSQSAIGQRLDHAARVVGEVQNKLGVMEESSKRIFDIGKDLAELQNILRAPKLRGGLGELFLEDLLRQIFPPQYFEMQYTFKSGERVDAALRLMNGLVPIDSKFPLESFKRISEAGSDDERRTARRSFNTDVKKHIEAIAKKYILPEEGTFDFALMYIPAENVYYETIIKDETFGEEHSIAHYALIRHVVPVSPNSFYAYLQAILLGLRGLHVEESAHQIIRTLQQLQGDFDKFSETFGLLGKHLNFAQSNFSEGEKRLEKLQTKLSQTLPDKEAAELAPEAPVGAKTLSDS
ncbi:MAG: DNA recombination protein RmuC [Acidobacteriia bacterium]|nr:DNA recombination protein RmuC [Terriglobia bacterium]